MATGSKRKRGDSWELRVYAGLDALTGRRRYVTRSVRGSERDADRALRRLVDEVEEGGRPSAKRRTFADAAERWLAAARLDLSPSTVMTTEDFLRRYLLPALGDRPIERIGAEDLDALYTSLRKQGRAGGKPLAPATVIRVHGIARVILEQARRWRWIARNPAHDASPPSMPRRRPTTPTAAVVAGFVAAVGEQDADFALYLRLAAIVGARRAELCALRWSDIDFDAGTLSVVRRLVAGRDAAGHETVYEMDGTKATAGHRVALDPSTIARLRAHRATCEERAAGCGVALTSDAHVFAVEPDGKEGWRPHSVTQRFRRLRDRHGMGAVRLHDIRHFVASHLIDQGVAVTTVAERVGHTSPRTTLAIYGHGVTETDRHAATLLATALDGGS